MNQGIAVADEKWDEEPGNEASEGTEPANKDATDEKSRGDDTAEAANVKDASSVGEGSK